jgi:hypothetical protein
MGLDLKIFDIAIGHMQQGHLPIFSSECGWEYGHMNQTSFILASTF